MANGIDGLTRFVQTSKESVHLHLDNFFWYAHPSITQINILPTTAPAIMPTAKQPRRNNTSVMSLPLKKPRSA